MANGMLILHLLAGGAWLGCVLTEVGFERLLKSPAAGDRRTLAALHRRVDLLVELPAMVLVLATGVALWGQGPGSAGLLAGAWRLKLALAALAWLANAVCIVVVLRRDHAARHGDDARFESLDVLQHRLGAVVLGGLVGAPLVAVLGA